MKLLKTIPLLLSLAVATAQAADVNPHPQSFGTWHDADGTAETSSSTKTALKNLPMYPPNAAKKAKVMCMKALG